MHAYVNDLVRRSAELGVQLRIVQDDHVVYEGKKCSGFFTHLPTPLLAFHTEGPNAESVMLHEAQHMEQWHENCKSWREYMLTSTVAVEDLMFLWIDKQIELKPAQARKYAQLSANVELDCERRTARLIRRLKKESKTTIDVKDYIQKANSSVLFWKMVGKSRQWYTIGKRPYELPEVYSEFPTTFSLDYTKLPKKYERLYEQHCL